MNGVGWLLLMDEAGGMECGWRVRFRVIGVGLVAFWGKNKCYAGVGFLVVGVS